MSRIGPRGKLGFLLHAIGLGALGVAVAHCSSDEVHPAPLNADVDSGFGGHDATTTADVQADVGAADTYVAPDTSNADVNTPTTVSISLGDGGSATDIYFGDRGFVDCGHAATSVPVTIANTGGGTLSWTAALSVGATYYTLSPASGTVNAGSSATLQVIPNAIPSTSPVTTEGYSGVLTITTNATNDTTHVVQLHETARGVILTSTLTGTFNFGGVAVNSKASSQFSLTNNGNVPAYVNLATGSQAFGVLNPALHDAFPFMLDATATGAPTVTFQPAALQDYTDTMVLTVVAPPDGGAASALCAPLPANVTLQGKGTNGVAISPTNLNFGFTNCGATAAAQTIRMTNNGPDLTWSSALAKAASSPYTISPSSGSVSSQSSVDITITPKTVPFPSATTPDGFGDTLTITTNSPSDAPHNITLNQTARGAILVYTPTTITTHDSVAGHVSFTQFSVTNQGNYEATYQLGDGTSAGAVTNIDATSGTWSSNVVGGNLVGGAGTTGTLSVVAAPKTTCGGSGTVYTCGYTGCKTSRSCADLGANCGNIDDGCGGTLNCGTCPNQADGGPEVCGAGGPNKCGVGTCTPSATCNGKCGPVMDGCGNVIQCSGCSGTQFLGKMTLTIKPNPDGLPTILCADAPPDLELSDEDP